jgi:hypothetical protein
LEAPFTSSGIEHYDSEHARDRGGEGVGRRVGAGYVWRGHRTQPELNEKYRMIARLLPLESLREMEDARDQSSTARRGLPFKGEREVLLTIREKLARSTTITRPRVLTLTMPCSLLFDCCVAIFNYTHAPGNIPQLTSPAVSACADAHIAVFTGSYYSIN